MEQGKSVPADYVEIKYDSLGLLGTPRVLHFRDYSMEETLKLAQSTETNNLKAMVECLNEMCWEDFECANLSMQDLLNTVYSIHYSFYSNTIRKNYYIDPDLDEELRDKEENIDEAEINLLSLKTTVLKEDCREKFTLVNKNNTKKVTFHYPKLKDLMEPMDYTNNLFFVIERHISEIIQKVNLITKIRDEAKRKEAYEALPEEDRKTYESYANDKAKAYTLAVQASVIEKIDGEEIPTLEEKCNRLSEVPNTIWDQYTFFMEDYNYGIVPDVTFYSQYLGKEVTRRFLFQHLDFLPDMGTPNPERYKIYFE
jgi:hypothetical protein